MNHHRLKSLPKYFALHSTGELEMSIRNNDRGYQVGDSCQFFEWIPGKGYTGNKSLFYRIRYILQASKGLMPGYVVLLLDGPWGCV